MSAKPLLFGAEFLGTIEKWSVWLAIAAAAVGTAITRDVRFGVSCLLGAAFDVTMLYAMLKMMPDEGPVEFDTRFAGVFAARLVGKSVLVVVAFLVPAVFSAWGMVIGVLMVEITMMTVGSVSAARRSFSNQENPPV